MTFVNVLEAKTKLSQLLAEAESGGDVVIAQLTCEDAELAVRLPLHYPNPMARLLIAAAIRTKRPIVTCDTALTTYTVETIW